MKIAFFATPEFAIPSMEAVLQSKHKIVCVVTQPDKPSGRGNKMEFSPAKLFAIKNNIPVIQPKRISREIDEIFTNIEKPDIIVTAAFGQILRQNVIDFCKYGVINVHASLLPKYRGSCPINMCLVNGEEKTGITIMQTDVGIDTGDILLQGEYDILPDETVAELTVKLANLGARLLVETLDNIEAGTVKRTPQNHDDATYFPMLEHSDGLIDFSKPAIENVNRVRGIPFAYAKSNYGDIKILKCHANGAQLVIDLIKAPGGKTMGYRDFLNGHRDFKFE